jgi:hypothetical protein
MWGGHGPPHLQPAVGVILTWGDERLWSVRAATFVWGGMGHGEESHGLIAYGHRIA